MTRSVLLLLLGLICAESRAQYNGPAVEACRAYAMKEELKHNKSAREIVFDRDQVLSIERYTRNLGSQLVSSILTGNGSIVLEGAPSAELSFICLLADEKRPLFFYWLPRQNPVALMQCMRDKALRAQPRPCLEILLQVAETDLTQVYGLAFQDARERDFGAKSEEFTVAYRKSNDEWRQYRDAECARRRALAPSDVPPDDYQMACMVDLTRRRALDMR